MQIVNIRAGKGIGPLAAGLRLHTFYQTWLARAGYHFEEFRDLQAAQGLANGATFRMHLFAHDLRTVIRRKDGNESTLLDEATRRVEEKKPSLLVFLQQLSGGRGEEPDLGAETAVGGVRYRLVYSLTANVSANWIEGA